MSEPKLQVEITGEAAGLYAVLEKVTEKLKGIQAGSDSSADAARRSMGLLEQGAKAAAQALKAAQDELTGIRAKLAASGGSGPDPAAAMARVQQAQAVYARVQAQQLIAEQTLGQERVMAYLRSAQATGTATRAVQEHTQAVQQSGMAHQSMAGSVFQAGASLMALRAALQGARQVLEDALRANLALEKAQRTLQMATGEGAQAMAFVRRTAKELGLELVATADGYAMMAAASKGTSMEGKATETVFRSVARASAAMSLSGEQTHGVILALSQMMSKGKVMAEELRKQLGEHLPGAFNIAARAMGVSTSELDNMLRSGKVLSSEFLPRFAAELEMALGDAPERAANSLQANLNRVKTAFQGLAYDIGQGEAGATLSEALGEIAKVLDSPEGFQAAREMSRDMAHLVTAGKDLSMVLWKIRDPLIAMAQAWVAVKVAQIIQGTVAWGSAKAALATQAIASRTAIIQEALATQGLTLAAGQSATAELAKAAAMLASRRATAENAIATGALSLAEGEATLKSITLAEAKIAEAAAVSAAGRAGNAAAGGLAALGGPVGWLIAGVGTLVFVLSQLKDSSLEAATAESDRLAQADRDRQASLGLIDDANRLNEVLQGNTASIEQKRRAQDRLQTIIQQLITLNPDLVQGLRREGETYIWNTEQLKKNTEHQIENAKETVKAAKIRLEAARLEQGRNIMEQTAGTPLQGLWAWFRSGDVEKRAKQELANLKESEKAVNELQAMLNRLSEEPKKGGGKGDKPGGSPGSDLSGILTTDEIQARLDSLRLAHQEEVTLVQKRDAAMLRAQREFDAEVARLKKESDAGKFKGNQEGLDALLQENLERRHRAELKAERDFNDAREKLSADLQARVAAQEEGGLAQRLETVRREFAKIREENAKLAESGKAALSEEQIQAAEMARTEQARIAQIKSDLAQLRQELAQLAQIKGGPLTSGEMAEAMDRFAQKSREAAAASSLLRQELHLNETAHQGWNAGVRQYLVQSENQYANFKGYATQMLTGIENAWGNTIQGILTGQIKGGEILKSVWRGTQAVVAQVAAQMIAKWLMLQVAGAALTKSQVAQSGAKTSASLAAGAAGAWEAYGWIPYYGAVLAMAQIALMETSVAGAAAAGAASKAFAGASPAGGGGSGPAATVNATGGYYTQPTWGLFAEKDHELVAPEVSFKQYSSNLAANILAQERRAQGYQLQAGSYAQTARTVREARVASVPTPLQITIQQNAPVYDPSQRGMRGMAENFVDSVRVLQRERGVVLRPDAAVFGGM